MLQSAIWPAKVFCDRVLARYAIADSISVSAKCNHNDLPAPQRTACDSVHRASAACSRASDCPVSDVPPYIAVMRGIRRDDSLLAAAVVMAVLAAPALAQTSNTFPCPCMNSGQCLRIAGTTRTMCYCNQVRLQRRGGSRGASHVTWTVARLAASVFRLLARLRCPGSYGPWGDLRLPLKFRRGPQRGECHVMAHHALGFVWTAARPPYCLLLSDSPACVAQNPGYGKTYRGDRCQAESEE